jgi:NhaP-type Na+/H+ or K+/H+ antiporter
MTPDLVLLILLPGLLFEEAWNLDVATLRRDWKQLASVKKGTNN